MAIATRSTREVCESAKRASHLLATADTETKDAALARAAELLAERTDEILEANAGDVEAAGRPGSTPRSSTG
jgi:glutamate-5-semialdehyde dehydrogenase